MNKLRQYNPVFGFLRHNVLALRTLHTAFLYVRNVSLKSIDHPSPQAAKSKNELVAYYKKARKTMSKAARDVRASAAVIARKDRLVARKEEMMAEKRRLHAMGRVSVEEARAFIDKYR